MKALFSRHTVIHSTIITTPTPSLRPLFRVWQWRAQVWGCWIKAHGFFRNIQGDDGIMITINLANKEENAASIEFRRKQVSINLRHTLCRLLMLPRSESADPFQSVQVFISQGAERLHLARMTGLFGETRGLHLRNIPEDVKWTIFTALLTSIQFMSLSASVWFPLSLSLSLSWMIHSVRISESFESSCVHLVWYVTLQVEPRVDGLSKCMKDVLVTADTRLSLCKAQINIISGYNELFSSLSFCE